MIAAECGRKSEHDHSEEVHLFLPGRQGAGDGKYSNPTQVEEINHHISLLCRVEGLSASVIRKIIIRTPFINKTQFATENVKAADEVASARTTA
jgi:hypothetical protein